jgi:cytochrome bd-I ubiquinol oxidase subunit X
MWYFSWILGVGFACTLAVLNAMWLELQAAQPAKPAALAAVKSRRNA